MSMRISVVICTRNRASDLREVLDSLAAQNPPGELCEVVVVDNGSTDTTPKVVSDFTAPGWLSVRYVYEGVTGLSRARNTGIAAAQGEIIAFLDDDVIADQMWIRGILKAYQGEPDVSCVGGKILGVWVDQQPDWFVPGFYMLLGCADFGDKPRILTYPDKPIGCNMAIRKDIITKLGGFPPLLGRKEGNLLSNEECDFFYRVSRADEKMVYAPAAVVYHKIYPWRATRRYLLRRWYWQGISDALMGQLTELPGRSVHISRGLKALLGCRRPLIAVVWHQFQGRPQMVMGSLVWVCYCLGKAREELTLGIQRSSVDVKSDSFGA